MKLSNLQKYILRQAYLAKDRIIDKAVIEKYYDNQIKKLSRKNIITIVTHSVDKLISGDLVVGFGTKTSQKWYIKKIRLTKSGRHHAKKLIGLQQTLPFKKLKNKK